MASVEELLAAAQAQNQNPMASSATAALSGVANAQSTSLDRVTKLIQLDQLRRQQQEQDTLLKLFNAHLGAANETETQNALNAAGPAPRATLPVQKFKTSLEMGKDGVKLKLEEPTPKTDIFSPEQMAAISSGDQAALSKAFPGGVPKDAAQLALSTTRAGDVQAEREAKRAEARTRERLAIVDKFNADPATKKAQQAIAGAGTVRDLVDSGNPIAANAIPTFMARASGEVGNLSEADKRPFGGSQAILARLNAAATQATTGQITPANAEFVRSLANTMEASAKRNMDDLARVRAKQYSKAADYLKEGDIYNSLSPQDSGDSGGSDIAAKRAALRKKLAL